MAKKITEEEIDLAIEFLNKRTIDVRGDKRFKHLTEIFSLFEVITTLEILKKGKIKHFLKTVEKYKTEGYKIAGIHETRKKKHTRR